MSKIGLIVEGGGMKCAYSAGILDAMSDHNITFDYSIGVSAGAANLASFNGGQRGRNIRFYTTHIHEPDYFGVRSFIKTGDLFGLKYIYADLSNSDGADPINYQKIMENPSEYVIVATDAETGKAVYFTKEDMAQDDYRCIMGSCAIPAASRPVDINGRKYYDGGVSDSIPVQRALDDGCDKIVCILSKQHDFVKKPEGHKFLYSMMCRRYPKTIEAMNNRHIMYRQCQDTLFALEDAGKAFVFAPYPMPKMTAFTMDEKIMQGLYDMGIRHYAEREEEFNTFMGK